MADHGRRLGARGRGEARPRRVRLHRGRRGRGVDDAREPRRVRATGASGRGCSPGNVARDLSVDVLGLHSPAPFLLAPIGVLSIAHEEAEPAVGRAQLRRRACRWCSRARRRTRSRRSPRRACPRWFQLYWVNDREICASFVARAEAAGYAAIVVTLDTLTLGWRPRDLRSGVPAVPQRRGLRAVTSATRCSSRGSRSRRTKTCSPPRRRCSRRSRTSGSPGTTSTGCAAQTSLPLLVKGVLHRRRRAAARSSTASTA